MGGLLLKSETPHPWVGSASGRRSSMGKKRPGLRRPGLGNGKAEDGVMGYFATVPSGQTMRP